MLKKVNHLIAGLLFCSLSSYSQNAHVSGNIPGLKDTKVTIHYYKDSVQASDTVEVKNGKFSWTAKVPEPQKVYLLLPTGFKQFFVERGDIKITATADLKTFEVKGSKTQDESVAYEKALKDLTDQEEPLYQQYGKVSKEEQIALETKLNDLRMQKRARTNAYITAHPASAFSVSLVADRATMGEYKDVNDIYQKLDAAAQQTSQGRRIAVRLTVLKKSALGEKILDFTQNDTTGKPVQFANFKGKYVLVDFWASWCGPCRGENPNVLKAYNEYKDKNFTVVGISLDDKADRWEKPLKKTACPGHNSPT